jgi:hypothetical protein
MKRGDTVRVYPIEHHHEAAAALTDLISSNKLSCAVSFDDIPAWLFHSA